MFLNEFIMIRLSPLLLILTAAMLLVPPRWCCATAGTSASCCPACRTSTGQSCCWRCRSPVEGTDKPSKAPGDCACQNWQPKFDREPDKIVLDFPLTGAYAALPGDLGPTAADFFVVDILDPPPLNVQIWLCRWLC